MIWPFKKKKETIINQLESIFSSIQKEFDIIEVFDEKGVNIYTYTYKKINIDPDSLPILLNLLDQAEKLVQKYVFLSYNKTTSEISSISINSGDFSLYIVHHKKYYLIGISSKPSPSPILKKLKKTLRKLNDSNLIEEY